MGGWGRGGRTRHSSEFCARTLPPPSSRTSRAASSACRRRSAAATSRARGPAPCRCRATSPAAASARRRRSRAPASRGSRRSPPPHLDHLNTQNTRVEPASVVCVTGLRVWARRVFERASAAKAKATHLREAASAAARGACPWRRSLAAPRSLRLGDALLPFLLLHSVDRVLRRLTQRRLRLRRQERGHRVVVECLGREPGTAAAKHEGREGVRREGR